MKYSILLLLFALVGCSSDSSTSTAAELHL